jgi:hypothetical protein
MNDIPTAAAWKATNLLCLIRESRHFLSKWNRQLKEGLSCHKRDCMDMAGKLPIAVKALEIGLSPDHLVIDTAQAGGLHGRSDGLIVNSSGRREAIEIKVSALSCLLLLLVTVTKECLNITL